MASRTSTPDLGPAAKAVRSIWLISAPLLALALAALFVAESRDITGLEGTYPRVLAAVVALLAAVSIGRDTVEARRERSATAARSADGPLEGRRGEGVAGGRLALFVAVLVVSIGLMGWIGFFPAATLLVLGGLLVLGVRSAVKVVAYTVGVVVVAHLLFVEALGVAFPAPWN